jgi:DhnA family fructose-bisphosphate aldolase class Ia
LPGRHLQPLASPDPFAPLVVDQPASPAQQLGNLAITVAAVLPGQFDNVVRQPGVIVAAMRDLALRRAMLTERRAGTPLRDRQNASNMLDAGAATRGAQ